MRCDVLLLVVRSRRLGGISQEGQRWGGASTKSLAAGVAFGGEQIVWKLIGMDRSTPR